MAIPAYYFRVQFVKMGKWVLLPADSENWHGQYTSEYFRRIFGFNKGTTIIQTFADDLQHAYFPKFYIRKLYAFIQQLTARDYRALQNKLAPFYRLKTRAKREIPRLTARNFEQLSTVQLVRLYKQNRDWAHRVTPYDQFGWIAEDYWNPIMQRILMRKLKLKKNSPEYYRVMFTLTKPEEISTTLEEKRTVLGAAIQIKRKRLGLARASANLARQYGWMPVFTFGIPWGKGHYVEELAQFAHKSLSVLKREHAVLAQYAGIRNREFNEIVQKYTISPRELQVFIDFGLTLDARNEAEYLVSLAGYHLLPMYTEIARRLALSVKQVRLMYEDEIVRALQGKLDVHRLLASKSDIVGWGFNRQMTKRYNFAPREARRWFNHIERTVKNLQGGDEHRGLCANTGKVRGRARIVTSPEQVDKVKTGDVLIAHATTVDYLPAMKKAVAYVTEVGGLTCHAAVVAREFGVPCVVALTNATKNFKDGEVVEVDAGTGVVKRVR